MMRHTHGSAEPSMRLVRQIAAAACTLGRYCKNVSPSNKLDSMRYCNITKPFNCHLKDDHSPDNVNVPDNNYLTVCGISVTHYHARTSTKYVYGHKYAAYSLQ